MSRSAISKHQSRYLLNPGTVWDKDALTFHIMQSRDKDVDEIDDLKPKPHDTSAPPDPNTREELAVIEEELRAQTESNRPLSARPAPLAT